MESHPSVKNVGIAIGIQTNSVIMEDSMGAKSVKFKLGTPVSVRYIQHQIASPFVVTVLWLVINNVTIKTKQDVTNAESFLDTNVLEELAKNQAALSHVEMVLKPL